MASDETSAVLSPPVHDDFDHYHDHDDGYDLHHSHPHSSHNLSRLSVCTSSMYTTTDDGDEESMSRMFMSGLSIESFDADAEDNDDDKGKKSFDLISSEDFDSDKDPASCRSLPVTPPRRRRNRGERGGVAVAGSLIAAAVKQYASENEGGGAKSKRNSRRRRLTSDQRIGGRRFFTDYGNGWSGESENGGAGGMVVITRPKGGNRSLCMDLGEVKACKDLGFELEHERMVEVPGRVSVSGTSSGGDSPIANWRISSPGDDPRDVKARLKMWAQAVALVSTANHSSNFH